MARARDRAGIVNAIDSSDSVIVFRADFTPNSAPLDLSSDGAASPSRRRLGGYAKLRWPLNRGRDEAQP
jgi:hypothetical protein